MKTISSRQNALVRRYRAIAAGEERTSILLDGPHLVAEALAAGLNVHHALISADGIERADLKALVEQFERQHVDFVAAHRRVMAAVSPVRSPSAIVAIVARPLASEERLFSAHPSLIVIACDVQDPGNLGAIARAAEAAGASGLIACGQSADPFGWKALRGSMGSALRLPLAIKSQAAEAIDTARRHGCRIAATCPRDGQSIFDVDFRGPLALLIGAEGSGLPQPLIERADMRLTIPMKAPVESLNTAVTAALILYEARRQRNKEQADPVGPAFRRT